MKHQSNFEKFFLETLFRDQSTVVQTVAQVQNTLSVVYAKHLTVATILIQCAMKL